jgi:16S rRNA (adenine1518-N6/adenine1519-N6)-dimethyltransferase
VSDSAAKPSGVRETLRAIRVTPVKTLGQNFLHDPNLARWIVEQADLSADDEVLEIGPGLGALTAVILDEGARVLAVEKDARLANFLREKFATPRLEVRHADALDFDVRALFAVPRAKLLGNLPYNIASQLVVDYLAYPSPFSLVILMLQKEMAERLCAIPSTKSYGALTLQLQFHYHIKYIRKVPATVFIPAPDVDSAIISIQPRQGTDVPACDFELFVRLVRCGFSQRRKQLGNLLADYVADWPSTAHALGFDRHVRAENLSLEQWVQLTNQVRPIPPSDREKSDAEWFPVVDQKDRVLRAAPRGEVHGNNLLHRAVHILIFGENDDIYLQKRSRWKDRHPLVWDSSAAGHVAAGEEYDSAAKRELMEELGINTELQPICKLPATEQTGQEFIQLYRGRYQGEFRLNLGEIEMGAYFPSQIVTGWIAARPQDFAPGFAECWRAYGKAVA